MRISKHTFQDHCGDSYHAQKLMSIVSAKLPTKTMPVTINRLYNTTYADGMASVVTVDAIDALALCDRMLVSTHPKVNKEHWLEIKETTSIVVNRTLAQC